MKTKTDYPLNTLQIPPMKKQLNAGWAGDLSTGTSLQLLINRLVSNSIAAMKRNKTTVVNDVPAGIWVTKDENNLTPVIKELLTTMVLNSRSGIIHINAEKYKDVVVLEMQERNTFNGYALAFSLKSIESRAEIIGGNISVNGAHQLVTTVSFSFPN